MELDESMKPKDLVTDMWRTGPPPAKGQRQRYPSRFWHCFKEAYPSIIQSIHDDEIVLVKGKKVLHMFSGSLSWGDTTDIRPETGAKIVAPYNHLPIPDDTYDVVIADPPYNEIFAKEWKTDLPVPKRILIEATRVTKPSGLIAILHIIHIPAYKEAKVNLIGIHAVLTGNNNALRCLNVYRKKGGMPTDKRFLTEAFG